MDYLIFVAVVVLGLGAVALGWFRMRRHNDRTSGAILIVAGVLLLSIYFWDINFNVTSTPDRPK